MALTDDFDTRRRNEQNYSIDQNAKQGYSYKSRAHYLYNVWLVEGYRNTLNQNPRYHQEVLRPQNLIPDQTKVWAELGGLVDIELTKDSALGMKLFKDINPKLPLAEQIRNKYRNANSLFKEIAIIGPESNIISYSPEESKIEAPKAREFNTQVSTTTPLKTEAVKVDQKAEQETKEQYSVDQSYQSYFSRKQISHNRMIVLGDRQKEIQLAHMFDNHILVIDGGPGTGKTSTMIQRLKLLISSTFYTDPEYNAEDFSNGTDLNHLKNIWNDFLKDKTDKNDTWMFFSPTIQLNEFLKNSLSGEGLKYIPESTKVWVNRSRKTLTGYCIELARDLYHFVDSTPLKAELEDEFFHASPVSLYQTFEGKLLEQFKEDRFEALEELNRLQKKAGIEQPKDTSYQPTSFESIFKYSASDCKNTFDDIDTNSQVSKNFVKQLSEQLQNELYAVCSEEFPNDEKCSYFIKNRLTTSETLRNRILSRIVLFWFIEKNNRKLFDEIFSTDNDLLKQYEALRELFFETRLSDFKKGFCNTSTKNCDKSIQSKGGETSYCINVPYKEQFSDATKTTMNIFFDNLAQKEGYPLSTKAYQTFFTATKGAIQRNGFDRKHGNIQWVHYFTENLEAELKRITEKLIWCIIKNYVNNDNKYIGSDFRNSWFVTSEISKAWVNFRNVEKARKELYKKEDFDILFSTTFKKIYDEFRQENGFDGPYKIQELSFQIYAANTLTQKLHKANKNAFVQLIPRNSIINAYHTAARIIIGIDESTDFTPVELAAMASLGHPEYNCITLAGDQMQAFNEKGITNWSQLQNGIFFNPCAIMDLKISYRQSHTLLEMAKKIYKRALSKEAPYDSYVTLPRESAPLLLRSNDHNEKIKWLANRIKSIEKASGYQPATAIFYPSDSKAEIEEFVEDFNNYISVESCFSTTDSKIIVYPLSLVKGLEFEVAFFYDLDTIKDTVMQQRYLYVGLSRATFYLGATSSSSWNDDLSKDFETDIQKANWPLAEGEKPLPPSNDDVKKVFVNEAKNVPKKEEPPKVKTTPSTSTQDVNKSPSTTTASNHAERRVLTGTIHPNKIQQIPPKENIKIPTITTIVDENNQIKPKDWADQQGLKVDVVMKLLRDAGVLVRTHMSKLDASEYNKIAEVAIVEKRKMEARYKNLRGVREQAPTYRTILPTDSNSLHPNARVHHDVFGNGTIISRNNAITNTTISVRFDRDNQIRTFNLNMALRYLKIIV